MAFRFRTPSASSSSTYNNFSDQPPEDGVWSGGSVGGAPGGSEFFRELEKRRIREEIIAQEVARKRFLEAEVRREFEIEREMKGMQTGFGYPSSFMLPPPPYRHHERFHSGVLHGESYPFVERRTAMPFPEDYGGEILGLDVVPFHRNPPSPMIKEIVTNVPKVIEDVVYSLAKPYHPIRSGAKRKPPPPPQSPMAAGSTDLCHTSKKKTEEWSCAICEVTATSEGNFQDHLSGKKHQAKVEDLRAKHTIKTDKSVIKNSPESVLVDSKEEVASEGESSRHKFRFWCRMCRVGASDENVMNQHKKGKKHLKNLVKVRRKSRNNKARIHSQRNHD